MENEPDAIVKERLDAINAAIQNAFLDGKINYLGCGSKIYKFELVNEGLPPCRLDFAWEYLLDNNENTILDKLRREKVFETISNASKPIKILVTEDEVRVENW